MSYVDRDTSGNIVSTYANAQYPGHEFVEGAVIYVPVVIPPNTPRQIRQAMTALGLRAEVEAAIASSSQDLKDWWEFAQSFERNHPMVVGMGQALGKTPAELDALFTLGATL